MCFNATKTSLDWIQLEVKTGNHFKRRLQNHFSVCLKSTSSSVDVFPCLAAETIKLEAAAPHLEPFDTKPTWTPCPALFLFPLSRWNRKRLCSPLLWFLYANRDGCLSPTWLTWEKLMTGRHQSCHLWSGIEDSGLKSRPWWFVKILQVFQMFGPIWLCF